MLYFHYITLATICQEFFQTFFEQKPNIAGAARAAAHAGAARATAHKKDWLSPVLLA